MLGLDLVVGFDAEPKDQERIAPGDLVRTGRDHRVVHRRADPDGREAGK